MKKTYIFLEQGDEIKSGDERYSDLSGWSSVSEVTGFKADSIDLIRRETTVGDTEPINSPEVDQESTAQLTLKQWEVVIAVIENAAFNSLSDNNAQFYHNILLRLDDRKAVL